MPDHQVACLGHQATALKYKLDDPAATLKLNANGSFKVLQFADMHYNNGRITKCSDVNTTSGFPCSDVNTTDFLRVLLETEKPDLVVFTGDNIDGGAISASASIKAWSDVIEKYNPREFFKLLVCPQICHRFLC